MVMIIRRQSVIKVFCALVAIPISGVAWCANYSVPCASGGTGSILDLNVAINSAAQDASASMVTLTAGCVFHLPSNTVGYFAAPDGSPSYFKNVTNDVVIIGNGATLTFDGGNSPPRRLFFVTASGSLTLNYLTLNGGVAQGENGGDSQADGTPGAGGAYSGLGGAIYNAGNLVVDGVTFQNNMAIGGDGGAGNNGSGGGAGGGGLGGAIFSTGSIDVQRSLFQGNTANGGGVKGGRGCLDSNCYSNAGGGGGAGGVGGGFTPTGSAPGNGGYAGGGGGNPYGSGAGTSGGFAGGGGGDNSSGGSGGEFGGNGATGGFNGGGGGGLGGAVFVESTLGTASRIANSTFTANSAAGGGGKGGYGDGDGGSGAGGAIFLHQGTLTLSFNTIVGGSASGGSVRSANPQSGGNGVGGGVYVHSGATLNMDHTIISGNTTTAGTTTNGSAGAATDADLSGAISSSGHNLVNARGGSSGFIGSDFADGTDPNLGSLQNNGGPTSTFLPQAGSAVIDADTSANCNGGYATDQRGAPRPFAAGCDTGAVEVGDTIFRNGFETP
jgi:hypothetical protein